MPKMLLKPVKEMLNYYYYYHLSIHYTLLNVLLCPPICVIILKKMIVADIWICCVLDFSLKMCSKRFVCLTIEEKCHVVDDPDKKLK